jgi:hypothetical protein
MAIDVVLRPDDGMRLEAESFLTRYDPARFHHLAYGRRAPAGMYGASIMQIWAPFQEALTAVHTLIHARTFQSGDAWEAHLTEKLERLLYCLFEHVEDCGKIVDSCFPRDTESAKNPYVKYFRKGISGYRDRLGRIVNTMKHQQGRLRFLIFHAPSFVAPGYFVDGVWPDGTIAPHPTVHNQNSSAAFSFAFDLRLHFISLVLLSRNLCRTIGHIVGPPDREPPSPSSDTRLWRVATSLAGFTRIVFPDEFAEGFPSVQVLSVTGEPAIRVAYPSQFERGRRPSEPFLIRLSYRGDGASNMFGMPYTEIDPAYIDAG